MLINNLIPLKKKNLRNQICRDGLSVTKLNKKCIEYMLSLCGNTVRSTSRLEVAAQVGCFNCLLGRSKLQKQHYRLNLNENQ